MSHWKKKMGLLQQHHQIENKFALAPRFRHFD